jgi:hypothetical protein
MEAPWVLITDLLTVAGYVNNDKVINKDILVNPLKGRVKRKNTPHSKRIWDDQYAARF